VAQTTRAQIYSSSLTWIAMNQDQYHFVLNLVDAKTGTIIFTGLAYSRSCHTVMNDCPFLSYAVYQKRVDNHFTLTFNDYQFYLNIQDLWQAAILRQFGPVHVVPVVRTVTAQMTGEVMRSNF